MCLRVGKEWFVSNARKGSDHGRFTNTVEDLVPRSEITIDPRYLYGLITMIFHWNNAEVGSHYMVKRRMPRTFDNCSRSKGSKVRTVTKGPNKGRLICKPKKGHLVLGNKRGK